MSFRRRLGINLIEVTIAAAVLATVAAGFAAFQGAMVTMSQNERDRTFAIQKATQIMEELKAKAQAGSVSLDDYGQSETTFAFNLTTESVQPYDPLSDNPRRGVGYRFVRQIEVKPLPRDKGSRQVTVRVFISDGKTTPNKASNSNAIASLTNIFKTPPVVVVPTQLYQMHNLYLSDGFNGYWPGSSYWNPNWWSGFLSRGGDYLANANNGFTLDINNIAKTTYGRDPFYSPLINQNDYYTNYRDGRDFHMSAADNVPMNMVYFRPGNNSSGWETFISTAHFQKILANANQVGSQAPMDHEWDYSYKRFLENTDWYYDQNSTKFYEEQRVPTLADQHNHAVRYIEHFEKQYLWNTDNMAYTVRGLLDGMLGGQIRNPIIANVLGEHFPVMPLRNYSDAAHVPAEKATKALLASRWGVVDPGLSNGQIDDGSNARLVTHPLKLEYGQNDEVEFRVFPYKTKNINDNEGDMPDAYRRGIVVLRARVDNVGLTHQITKDELSKYLLGGINSNFTIEVCDRPTTSYGDYEWKQIWPDITSAAGVKYMASPVTVAASTANGYQKGDVVINLQNIPYTHKQILCDQNIWGIDTHDHLRGLPNGVSLYGYNYFPDPLLPTMGKDSGDAYLNSMPERQLDGGSQPRNTARFRIRFKVNTPVIVEAITTIGSEPILTKHQAPNRTRTWSWVGLPAPDSERIQMLGDPRHNPHLDVRLDKRYNRFFANLNANAYGLANADQGYYYLGVWNSFSDTAAGWGPNAGGIGKLEYDAPRYLELWRKALLKSNAMYFQPGPWGLRYMLLGDEFWPTWTYSQMPYTGNNTLGARDERLNPTIAADKDADSNANRWYSRNWLGELYPDNDWNDWRDHGNLPADDYRRMDVQSIDGFPADAKFKRTRQVDNWGMLSLLNSNLRFAYKPGAVSQNLTADYGNNMSLDMRAMLNKRVDLPGVYDLDNPSETLPSDWNFGAFSAGRTVLEPALPNGTKSYYGASEDNMAMAPMTLRNASGTEAAYLMFSSIPGAWNTTCDPNTLWRTFYTGIMQGVMDMAGPTYPSSGGSKAEAVRFRLLPRLKLIAPEDDSLVTGANLLIQWDKEWFRWDKKPYSRLYPDFTAGFSAAPKMIYQLKISEDSGKTFKYLNSSGAMTGTAAPVGGSAMFVNDPARTVTSENYLLDLSALKTKQYQIRIEGYRYDPNNPFTYERTHHSYVQFSINVVK